MILIRILIAVMLASSFTLNAEEECCTGSCWANGCCPGMKKCGAVSPVPPKCRELDFEIVEKITELRDSAVPRCTDDCSICEGGLCVKNSAECSENKPNRCFQW